MKIRILRVTMTALNKMTILKLYRFLCIKTKYYYPRLSRIEMKIAAINHVPFAYK